MIRNLEYVENTVRIHMLSYVRRLSVQFDTKYRIYIMLDRG